MKGFTLMMLLFYSVTVTAQQYFNKFTMSVNVGQALPIGEFKAGIKSDAPLEIAQKEPFAKSYSICMDIYVFRHLGITAGTSFYSIQPDDIAFEQMHGNPLTTDSYLRDYDFLMAHAGLKTRFLWGRFSFEPSLSGGSVSIETDYADAYLSTEAGAIYRTISYRYGKSFSAALITSVNVYGEIFKLGSAHFGIHAIGETIFMNPEISQTKIITDKLTKEISETATVYRQSMSLFYFGIGLSVRYGHNK